MSEQKKSVYEILSEINVNEHTEKKNGLTYLSWAWAWGIAKSKFPDMSYRIYENEHGWNYFTDGRTCWVKTSVTIEGNEIIEYLPVMDYNNRSIPYEKVTSFAVNTAIQRSLTKALARHGLGLYIYAGEDLPEASEKKTDEERMLDSRPPVEVMKEAIIKDYSSNRLVKMLDHFGAASVDDLTPAQLVTAYDMRSDRKEVKA